MTIGTAKPDPGELAAVKHYFIDEFPVTRALSAADFESLALNYLDKILAHKNTAVVCGGTGLYIKALCEGLDDMPETDAEINAGVEAGYKLHGLSWLQAAVRQEDPEFYEIGEIQNPMRLMRALAFIRTTGASIVHYRSGVKKQRPFRIVKAGLELPREILYSRINARVDMMMKQGLLEEVIGLLPFRELKNLQTVGYTELFDHLDGKCTLQEAVEKIKQHTRNYAKRQMTWFTRDKEMHWFAADDKDIVEKILKL